MRTTALSRIVPRANFGDRVTAKLSPVFLKRCLSFLIDRWPKLTTIVVKKKVRHAMSTVSVRIDEELVQAARHAAKAEFRTVQGQVEFWAKVGRAALDNPELPASFIAESLMSMAEPRDDSTLFIPRSHSKR